jgi:leucyl-tRNA synthetase
MYACPSVCTRVCVLLCSIGVAPQEWTDKNIQHMQHQLRCLGFWFDEDREFRTCDPEYYRWTQWIFLRMFERYVWDLSGVDWCKHKT